MTKVFSVWGGPGSTVVRVILPITPSGEPGAFGIPAASGDHHTRRAIDTRAVDAAHLDEFFETSADIVILVGRSRKDDLVLADGSTVPIARVLEVSRHSGKWVVLIPCPEKSVRGRAHKLPTLSQSVQLASDLASEIEKHRFIVLVDVSGLLEALAGSQGFYVKTKIACEIPAEEDTQLAFGVILCFEDDAEKLCIY